MAEERDFLRRWSQRKADARKGMPVDEVEEPAGPAVADTPEPGAMPVVAPDAEAAEAESDELDIPEELRGIDIDALEYSDDFTVFMKPGVPTALRKKALRRLWRTNPVLANLDGLNDYEEDFTDAAVAVKGLQSAYRIGRGFLTAAEVQAEQAQAAASDAAAKAEEETTAGAGEKADEDESAKNAGAADDSVVESSGKDCAAETGEVDGDPVTGPAADRTA